MANDLDPVGIMVLACATALGGGLVHDALIGAIPPQAVRDWRYFGLSLIAALLVFLWHDSLSALPPRWLATIDAGGLAVVSIWVGDWKRVDPR